MRWKTAFPYIFQKRNSLEVTCGNYMDGAAVLDHGCPEHLTISHCSVVVHIGDLETVKNRGKNILATQRFLMLNILIQQSFCYTLEIIKTISNY
jgi:hypothetical protein